jgi:hypothetical protein
MLSPGWRYRTLFAGGIYRSVMCTAAYCSRPPLYTLADVSAHMSFIGTENKCTTKVMFSIYSNMLRIYIVSAYQSP